MLVEAASFVKILPFNRALAASELEGENMRTFCGNVGSAVVDIVGNFELHGSATSPWLYLANCTRTHTIYVRRANRGLVAFLEGVVL